VFVGRAFPPSFFPSFLPSSPPAIIGDGSSGDSGWQWWEPLYFGTRSLAPSFSFFLIPSHTFRLVLARSFVPFCLAFLPSTLNEERKGRDVLKKRKSWLRGRRGDDKAGASVAGKKKGAAAAGSGAEEGDGGEPGELILRYLSEFAFFACFALGLGLCVCVCVCVFADAWCREG
jgi:hypothetical protein